MTTTSADLTPFGFTPTESSVYFALLNRGPSTGYGIARELSIARANAYQALRGLVSKGGAIVVDGHPARFRAVRPDVLLAQITEQQAGRLDRLQQDLERMPAGGADAIVRVSGSRAVFDLISRTAARETGPMTFLGSISALTPLIPVLRKRAADASATAVWVVGAAGALPVPIVDAIPEGRMGEYFPHEAMLVLTATAGFAVRLDGAETGAVWTSDPTLMGALRAALAALTAGAPA
jgi:DNA-binding MarR family transcriptional regulator